MYKKILVGLITGFISGLLATGGGLILLKRVKSKNNIFEAYKYYSYKYNLFKI